MKKIYVFFTFIFLIIENIPVSYGEDINLEASVLSLCHGGRRKLYRTVVNIGNDIKVSADLLTFENNKTFEFIDNVVVDVEQNISIACKKCIYSRDEQVVVFYDVKITQDDVVFTSSKCHYNIKKKCLEYKDGGILYKGNTKIFGQNGFIYAEARRVQILNNITIDVIFKDKNIKITCEMFDYNINQKQILVDKNVKIELDIDREDKFILTSGNSVRYELDNGMVFFEKIKINFKNNTGISNTAVFDTNKTTIKFEGNVNLKFPDGRELNCGKVNYNFLERNGLCEGKPTVNIDKNTKIHFEDIAFKL